MTFSLHQEGIVMSSQITHTQSSTHCDNTLSGRIGKVVASHAAVARLIPLRCTDLYYARGAQGVLPLRVGGATSQLDLPSLTPLSVAGCCRLQLGVPHWATSVITASS